MEYMYRYIFLLYLLKAPFPSPFACHETSSSAQEVTGPSRTTY